MLVTEKRIPLIAVVVVGWYSWREAFERFFPTGAREVYAISKETARGPLNDFFQKAGALVEGVSILYPSHYQYSNMKEIVEWIRENRPGVMIAERNLNLTYEEVAARDLQRRAYFQAMHAAQKR